MQGLNPRLGGDIRRMNRRLLDVLALILLREGDAIHHRVEVRLNGNVSIAMTPLAAIDLLHVAIGKNLRLVVDLPHLDVAILRDDQDGIVLPLAGNQIIRIRRIAGVGVQVSIVEIRTEVDSHT